MSELRSRVRQPQPRVNVCGSGPVPGPPVAPAVPVVSIASAHRSALAAMFGDVAVTRKPTPPAIASAKGALPAAAVASATSTQATVPGAHASPCAIARTLDDFRHAHNVVQLRMEEQERALRDASQRPWLGEVRTGKEDDHNPAIVGPDTCWPSGRGAWAVVARDAREMLASDMLGNNANSAVVHVSTDGTLAELPVDLLQSHTMPSGEVVFKHFDFDGDGDDELFIYAEWQYGEGTEEYRSYLMTYQQGRVVPFGPYAAIGFQEFSRRQRANLADATGDGRPDLLTYLRVGDTKDCVSEFVSEEIVGPFLYHSLPDGTFSSTDKTARDYVRTRWCSEKPRKLTSPREIICARLLGEPMAALEARFRTTVTPWDCELADDHQKPTANHDFESMTQALSVPLPFSRL
jgi:hypothetical protein